MSCDLRTRTAVLLKSCVGFYLENNDEATKQKLSLEVKESIDATFRQCVFAYSSTSIPIAYPLTEKF
jgi:hypothetical protein